MQAFAMASDEALDAAIAEDALFNYAKLQYELGGGAFNGAINMLTRYIDRYPSSPRAGEARTLLIAAYYNSRDYDAAYRAIRSMPSTDADIRAALQKITYFRALEAYGEGDLQAAQRYLAESAAANVSPKYAALNDFWQGEIAFAQGDYPVAAAKYNAYLRRAPRSAREYALAWYNLGYCAFDRDDMAQARSAFGRFLDAYAPRDRYRADAFNRVGDAAYAERKFDEAVASTWSSDPRRNPPKRRRRCRASARSTSPRGVWTITSTTPPGQAWRATFRRSRATRCRSSRRRTSIWPTSPRRRPGRSAIMSRTTRKDTT